MAVQLGWTFDDDGIGVEEVVLKPEPRRAEVVPSTQLHLGLPLPDEYGTEPMFVEGA